jgi:hypothetical protein
MNKNSIIITLGISIILANSLAGLILSFYSLFNWLISDFIILINTFLLIIFVNRKIIDGFKIGITLIFTLLTLLQFVMSIFMKSTFQNNYLLIGIIFIYLTQFSLGIISKYLSSSVNR